MKLLSFGEIVWDVHGADVNLGGASLNLAVHTAMQGERAVLVSAVGNDDLGREAVRIAKDYGVDTEFVSIVEDVETAVCTVTVGEMGTPSYALMDHASFDSMTLPVIDEYMDVIAFGTLSLRRGNNREVIGRLLERVSHGEVFCDINLRAPFYSEETVRFCLSGATLLKVSDEELPEVGRIVLGDSRSIESTVEGLYAVYPNIKLFIITLGENGSLCFDSKSGEWYKCPAKKIEAISTVGAGDSFSAAFLVRYMRGDSIPYCLEYASEISSLVCADKGAFSSKMAEHIRGLCHYRSANMEITVKTKYLVFPVNKLGSHKRVRFKEDGHEVYALNMRLDGIAPDYFAYIDVSRFMGKTLTVETDPKTEVIPRETDVMDIPNLYNEPLRPQVHFTAKNGWINDPNGLIYLDGEYHMFYQYNPCDVMWENMHWGHAVSRDLVHWKELDIALFPDENGACFSGCAITDDKNLLGLNKDGNKAGIVYYTATGPFRQRMLVSTDNFRTLTSYSDKPAVPFLGHEERDPKVVFCEELDCYVMALYIKDSDYALFKSRDLVNWERFFEYTLEGENEFPDILKFKDASGKTRYVLTSNTDHYVVALVSDGQFKIDEDIKPLFYCSNNHSPLSFWGVPDGRCIRAVWICYCSFLYPENFYGQLLALEYTLEEIDGKHYLAAKPVREIEGLYSTSVLLENVSVGAEHAEYPLEDKPYLIKLKGRKFTEGVMKIKFFGREIIVNFADNRISFDWWDPKYPRYCPITVAGDNLDITFLIDRGGFEIFSDGGKSCLYSIGNKAIPDRNVRVLELYSDGEEYILDSLEIHSLESIWDRGE